MADGPDDPKQKADKAWRWCERQWDRAPSPSQMVEAAVTASIEAALAEALAPVLERVARLEELAQFPTLMAENDALLQKMADAPCAICNGARWVCDVSVDGASYHRKPCPDCSKPATGPEGEKSMPSRLESLQPKPRTTPKKFARDLKERIARVASCFEDEHTAMGVRYVLGIVDAALSDYDVRDPEDFARVGAKTWQPTAASTEGPPKHDVGRPHIVNGQFQSDKYPSCPAGKVPLSVKDKAAQPLLWQYAESHRSIDEVFSDDLQWALRQAGYSPQNPSPAESEGETACTRHGQYRCPACAAGMVEEPQNPSPAEPEGKPDWADWMATNEYHQSLGAKWMCEAIVSKYAPDEREFVHAFARKWEDPSFWRPKTEPAPTAKPCPLKECSETAPHSHAPNTGWIRPDSWDYENNRPRETAPAATQDIPQSVPQAPERIRLQFRGGTPFIGGTLQPALNVSDAEYVRADLLEAAEAKLDHSQRKYRASCRHIEELAREDEEKRARLEAAERRIAELDGKLTDMTARCGLVAEAFDEESAEHLETDQKSIRLEYELQEARARIAELEQSDRNMADIIRGLENGLGEAQKEARAEGREAGVREAAKVAERLARAGIVSMSPGQIVADVIALLAKKPEVGT